MAEGREVAWHPRHRSSFLQPHAPCLMLKVMLGTLSVEVSSKVIVNWSICAVVENHSKVDVANF